MNHTGRVLCLLVLAIPEAHSQDVEHVEGQSSLTYEATTEDKAMRRIVETATENEQYAPVPRAAFSDFTFPRDLEEYESLDGWGLVTITAVSQLAGELPFARVYLRNGARGIELTRIAERTTTLDEPPVVVEVLGRYRYDAVYEFPLFIRATTVELAIDFAANRTGFVLTTFPIPEPPGGFPLEPPTAEHPAKDAVAAIVAREIPLLAPHLEP